MRYFKQTQGFSCGPACARMMLHELGIEVQEDELIKEMEAASHKGTPMENWQLLAPKYGVEVISKQPGTLEEIEKLRSDGWKITILIMADVPHYLGFLGIENGRVYMHDPWDTPNYSLLERNFMKKWVIHPEKCRKDSIYISNRWFVGIKKNAIASKKHKNLKNVKKS